MVHDADYSRDAVLFELYRLVHNEIWPHDPVSFEHPPVYFPLKRTQGAEPPIAVGVLRSAACRGLNLDEVLDILQGRAGRSTDQTSLATRLLQSPITDVFEAPTSDCLEDLPAPSSCSDIVDSDTATTQCWFYDFRGSKDQTEEGSSLDSLLQGIDDLKMDMDE